MAGLLDEIRQHVRGARGPQCPVARILTTLDERDADQLREALNDRAHITGSAIGAALRARGHQVSDAGIRTHRNGQCACEKGP